MNKKTLLRGTSPLDTRRNQRRNEEKAWKAEKAVFLPRRDALALMIARMTKKARKALQVQAGFRPAQAIYGDHPMQKGGRSHYIGGCSASLAAFKATTGFRIGGA